jgi:predicted DNA-binding transcriptional regulator YafY
MGPHDCDRDPISQGLVQWHEPEQLTSQSVVNIEAAMRYVKTRYPQLYALPVVCAHCKSLPTGTRHICMLAVADWVWQMTAEEKRKIGSVSTAVEKTANAMRVIQAEPVTSWRLG